MFVLTRTDPDAPKHRGISYLLLDMKSPGVTVRPLINMANGHVFNEVFFEDVHVPVRNRIGEENRGWYVGTTTLDFERSNIARAITARKNVGRMANYVRDRAAANAPVSAAYRLEVADRAGLEAGKVTARARLAESLAPGDFATQHRGKVLCLLLLGPVQHDRGADQVEHLAARGRPGFVQFLAEHELLEDGHVGAAVFLRPGGSEPAVGPELIQPCLGALRVSGAFHSLVFILHAGHTPVGVNEFADLRPPGCEFRSVLETHRAASESGLFAGFYAQMGGPCGQASR
jgi:hypothetical protein